MEKSGYGLMGYGVEELLRVSAIAKGREGVLQYYRMF